MWISAGDHHRATAHQVIIPKLRAGFIMHGLQMDDGLTIILAYYFKEVRREACKVRSGEKRVVGKVAEVLGLP